MSLSRSLLLYILVVGVGALAAASPVLAGCSGTDNCTVEPACCSACAHCSSNEACTCTYTCGGGVASCSCTCAEEGGVHLSPNLNLAIDMETPGTGFSVGGPASITLGDIAEILEGGFNWNVHVDSAIEGDTVANGEWSGTFEQALQDFVDDQGVNLSVDEVSKTITFTEN
jgi:hypothetical protein